MFTVKQLISSIGVSAVPAPYNGKKIETILLVEEIAFFGEQLFTPVFFDEEGRECVLTGIPWGAFWEAEVLSDLLPRETALWLWEDINFHGDEEASSEFFAELTESFYEGELE